MKIEVYDDAESVDREAAGLVAGIARAAVANRGLFVMDVSGGHIPWLMLRDLAKVEVPWKAVHVVQVDERVAPARDPDRNLTHLRESVFEHAPLRPEQIHAMPVELSDLERAPAQYEQTLRKIAGLQPVLDLVHLQLLQQGHVETYEGSVRYLHAAREAGLRTPIVSSSKHCEQVLVSAGIADLFDARIDGNVAATEHLAGKPAPDTYLAAAHALSIEPAQAAVFEDALSGVEAGRAGQFGYVVGLDRVGHGRELHRHGADVLVTDLATLLEVAA